MDPREQEIKRLREHCEWLERELSYKDAVITRVLEQSPSGYVVAEPPDMRIRQIGLAGLGIISSSPLQQSKIPRDYLMGWRLLHKDGTPYTDCERPLERAVLQGRYADNVEVVLESPEGERRWVVVDASPVHDRQGKVVAGVAVFHDISTAKTMEAERIQGLTFFAHDMKSPLFGARSFLQRLLDGKLGQLQSEQISELSMVRELLDRVLALAMDFLDIARMGKDGFSLSFEPLHLGPLLHRLGKEFSSRAGQKGLVLECSIVQNLSPVRGDKRRLERVFVNLLDNAVKYTLEGRIRLVARNGTDDWLVIEVQDDGPGLSKKDLAQLFKVFHRGAASEGVEGTGLGLAAVRSIVEAHGGCVCAANRFPHGACFTVLLPAST